MFGSFVEQLTGQFVAWELRGRGWHVFSQPVELEPPYVPFFHHYPPSLPVVDDGQKATWLSLFAERIANRFKAPAQEPVQSNDVLDYFSLDPTPFVPEGALVELSLSLPDERTKVLYAAEHLLLNLSYCRFPVSFELIGTSTEIVVQFSCYEVDLNQLKQVLQVCFPGVTISMEQQALRTLCSGSDHVVVADCAVSEEFMRPLRTFKTFEPDPLTGIIGALDNLGNGESAVLQVLFQAAHQPWAESILRSVTDENGDSFFIDAPEMVSFAREKVSRPLFAVAIRAAARASSSSRSLEIVSSIASGLRALTASSSNELIPLNNDGYSDQDHLEDVLNRQTRRTGMLLNSEELAGIVHMPSPTVASRKLRQQTRKSKAAPSIALHHDLVLGENIHQGKRTVVSLSTEQRLKHVYVVGATGAGKSTLLQRCIQQDMKLGNGLALLDPHGDLADQVLSSVPGERFDDVVIFDPADAEYPVGFNILSAHSEVEKNVLASDLVAVFKRLSSSWGDQMTTVLSNAILAFLEGETEGTLLELRRFLAEAPYRQAFLRTVADPQVRYFWEREFPLLRGNSTASILTRLDAFLRHKLVRNIVAQKDGLNFEEIINGKKILIAKLSQGLIGEENAYLLGALLVSKIHQVVMARQTQAAGERTPFFLYIDEFQNFITPSMATLLSGGRKFSLSITVAHQELRTLWDLDTTVANSLMANPGTRICFRLGDFDAQKLKDGFSSFDAHDLQNLGVGEAIVRVERADHDFNLKTHQPEEIEEEKAVKIRTELIRLTREKYGRKIEPLEFMTTLEEPEIQPPPPIVKREIPPTSKKKELKQVPVRTPRVPAMIIREDTVAEEKQLSQHRYLQTLIKQMAEQRGYRATVEEPTPGASGRVDVGLERNGKKLACEISVTTSDAHELQNIKKCLSAGYETILVCSPEKKNLHAIKELVKKELEQGDQAKVLFFEPEELFLYLDQQAAKELVREERVKGYRVKVQYQAVSEAERTRKREAVAQVIVQAMRRLKKGS